MRAIRFKLNIGDIFRRGGEEVGSGNEIEEEGEAAGRVEGKVHSRYWRLKKEEL